MIRELVFFGFGGEFFDLVWVDDKFLFFSCGDRWRNGYIIRVFIWFSCFRKGGVFFVVFGGIFKYE